MYKFYRIYRLKREAKKRDIELQNLYHNLSFHNSDKAAKDIKNEIHFLEILQGITLRQIEYLQKQKSWF